MTRGRFCAIYEYHCPLLHSMIPGTTLYEELTFLKAVGKRLSNLPVTQGLLVSLQQSWKDVVDATHVYQDPLLQF
jgi:hypothetical protein